MAETTPVNYIGILQAKEDAAEPEDTGIRLEPLGSGTLRNEYLASRQAEDAENQAQRLIDEELAKVRSFSPIVL